MKTKPGIYDEYDFPHNYDAQKHDWSFIKGVAFFAFACFLLLIAFLKRQ